MFGLLAAVLFGASTPFAKRLLDDAAPQVLAGLLYLGAFLALLAAAPLRRRTREARIRAADLPRLAGLTVAGGVLAPVLLLVGLERITGTTASLLLNLEGPLTLLLGLIVFREHLSRRPVIGSVIIFAAAALLTLDPIGGSNDLLGGACIALACVLWAVDNNLTQSLTTRDPFAIVRIKTGVAAAVNLTIAIARGADRPTTSAIAAAIVLGALSYGLSVVLDAYALRLLGAAREAVIFATAPFAGAVLAVPVLSETLGARELLAAAAMAIGVALMLTERHAHLHVHEPLEHDHIHVHDEHHRHEHAGGTSTDAPHSHAHRHDQLVHAHPHVSDVHHRHLH
jgi:drug/metabolite transporter (DMT)-like permease